MVVCNSASSTWKEIMKIRDKLAPNNNREITKCKDTDLGRDPWINKEYFID